MFKRSIKVLVTFSALLLGVASFAADNSPILGAWSMELDVQGQVFTLELNVTESTDGLAGTFGAAEFGVSPVSNLAFDGETLKFDADDTQGGTINVALKLADNQLSGNLSSPMGELPVIATKR